MYLTMDKTMLTMEQVFNLIAAERQRQDDKWGSLDTRKQPLAGHLLTISAELQEAKHGWQKNISGKHSALRELIQVAAVCVAAIQQYGPEGNG